MVFTSAAYIQIFTMKANKMNPDQTAPEQSDMDPHCFHSKIDKTKILKTNGSLMKVESIAKCSLGAFCNTFDLH